MEKTSGVRCNNILCYEQHIKAVNLGDVWANISDDEVDQELVGVYYWKNTRPIRDKHKNNNQKVQAYCQNCKQFVGHKYLDGDCAFKFYHSLFKIKAVQNAPYLFKISNKPMVIKCYDENEVLSVIEEKFPDTLVNNGRNRIYINEKKVFMQGPSTDQLYKSFKWVASENNFVWKDDCIKQDFLIWLCLFPDALRLFKDWGVIIKQIEKLKNIDISILERCQQKILRLVDINKLNDQGFVLYNATCEEIMERIDRHFEHLDGLYPQFQTIRFDELYQAKNSGKCFISIDLRSANFNIIKILEQTIIPNCSSWEEFMTQTMDEYLEDNSFHDKILTILKSQKARRQQILGKVCPKRVQFAEKYFMKKLASIIVSSAPEDYYPNIFIFSCDEILIEVPQLDWDKHLENIEAKLRNLFYNSRVLNIINISAFTLLGYKIEDMKKFEMYEQKPPDTTNNKPKEKKLYEDPVFECPKEFGFEYEKPVDTTFVRYLLNVDKEKTFCMQYKHIRSYYRIKFHIHLLNLREDLNNIHINSNLGYLQSVKGTNINYVQGETQDRLPTIRKLSNDRVED